MDISGGGRFCWGAYGLPYMKSTAFLRMMDGLSGLSPLESCLDVSTVKSLCLDRPKSTPKLSEVIRKDNVPLLAVKLMLISGLHLSAVGHLQQLKAMQNPIGGMLSVWLGHSSSSGKVILGQAHFCGWVWEVTCSIAPLLVSCFTFQVSSLLVMQRLRFHS